MPRLRKLPFCAFCGDDIPLRPGQRISPRPLKRFCSPDCRASEKESRGALSRVREWFRAQVARAIISPPPPDAVRRLTAKPGFGRSPLAINELRNATEDPIEETQPEEVAEL